MGGASVLGVLLKSLHLESYESYAPVSTSQSIAVEAPNPKEPSRHLQACRAQKSRCALVHPRLVLLNSANVFH